MAQVTGKVLTVEEGNLFPWHFMLIGALLVFGGLPAIQASVVLGIVLILLGATILTARSGFQIDESEKKYREYNSFLFIKTGGWESYNAIETIFINASKVSQQMYGPRTTQSSTFTSHEYNGYLKFTSGEKVHVVSSKNKGALLKKLEKLSTYLNAGIVDYTN